MDEKINDTDREITKLNEAKKDDGEFNPPLYDGLDLSDDVIGILKERQFKSALAQKKADINLFDFKIDDYKANLIKNQTVYVNEYELTSSRCKLLYELSKAKLCEYWNGVMHGDSSNIEIPPVLNIEFLAQEIIHEIKILSLRRSDG